MQVINLEDSNKKITCSFQTEPGCNKPLKSKFVQRSTSNFWTGPTESLTMSENNLNEVNTNIMADKHRPTTKFKSDSWTDISNFGTDQVHQMIKATGCIIRIIEKGFDGVETLTIRPGIQ